MFFFQDMDQQPFIRNGLELQNEVLCKKIKKNKSILQGILFIL